MRISIQFSESRTKWECQVVDVDTGKLMFARKVDRSGRTAKTAPTVNGQDARSNGAPKDPPAPEAHIEKTYAEFRENSFQKIREIMSYLTQQASDLVLPTDPAEEIYAPKVEKRLGRLLSNPGVRPTAEQLALYFAAHYYEDGLDKLDAKALAARVNRDLMIKLKPDEVWQHARHLGYFTRSKPRPKMRTPQA